MVAPRPARHHRLKFRWTLQNYASTIAPTMTVREPAKKRSTKRKSEDARPVGRPTSFNPKIAEEICLRIASGESMKQLCEAADMPDRRTVLRWLAANEEFATQCAHARTLQADYMDDLVLETANACTPESAASDRVRIAAYQWRAAKLAPKRYGEKSTVDVHATVTLESLVTASLKPPTE